ncbi:MAG: tRNA (N6-threonylcarbamoyladenosine(37)-N6)-methyltransferase TrmO [Chloroflexota bacterium]
MENKGFQIYPIGAVKRQTEQISIELNPSHHPALGGLDQFSHVIVYWWAEQYDTEDYRATTVVPLPYANNQEAGVFSCRAPVRPNLIMSTVCEILEINQEQGIIKIKNIDAFDGTPIIDLKAYLPIMDRVTDVKVPDYLREWPEAVPAEGIGLFEDEQ